MPGGREKARIAGVGDMVGSGGHIFHRLSGGRVGGKESVEDTIVGR